MAARSKQGRKNANPHWPRSAKGDTPGDAPLIDFVELDSRDSCAASGVPSWTASKFDAPTVDRQAGEQALDALVIADVSGTIVEWTEGAETLFGYTAEETIGQSLNLVAPESLRPAHWRRLSAVMAKRTINTAQPIRATAVHKNGERLEVEVKVTVLRAGTIANGIAALVRNLPERQAAKRRWAAWGWRDEQTRPYTDHSLNSATMAASAFLPGRPQSNSMLPIGGPPSASRLRGGQFDMRMPGQSGLSRRHLRPGRA